MAFASNPLMARGLDPAPGDMPVSCDCDAMPRILIADDNPDLIDALRLLLKGAGIEFDAVTSPEAAVRALKSRAFDLVLMDLNYTGDTTSGREGIDLLARVQEFDRLLPVIVMTGWGSVDLAVEAMRRGVRDFVQKPWDNGHLVSTLRQEIEAGALQLLMENFADPAVGCASGELLLGDPQSGESGRGVGLYWRMEKAIRQMESQSGSVVGATGAFYAVRRSLLASLPPETILDDVFLPMNVVRQGSRVVFDDRAHAWDLASQGTGREFARKVRTLTGNYQLVQLAPWLLTGQNPIRFEFVSHKLCRLLVPFALAVALVSSALLNGAFFRVALSLQLGFYVLSMLAIAQPGRGLIARGADAAFTFVLLNAAALVAFAKFVSGRKPVWTR